MNIIAAIQNVAHSSRFRCPSDVTKVQVYSEARGGYENTPFPFMGMRRFVRDYLSEPITKEMIDEADSLGCPDFDREMWEHILEKHKGYLPIKIVGAHEGDTCYPGEVIWTITSHDDVCALLPVMIDRLINSHVWFESTVCQRLKALYNTIGDYCETADLPRRFAGQLSGGTTQFGSDYLSAITNALIFFFFPQNLDGNAAQYINRLYNRNYTATKARFPDHSSIVMWDDENTVIEGLLDVHSNEWFSVLSDTYSYAHFFDEIVPQYKKQIANRTAPISFAVDCEDHQAAFDYALNSLKTTFGLCFNYKGLKTFDAPIVLCQLEELTSEEIKTAIDKLKRDKWSPLNFFWHISDHFIQEHLSRSTNGFISKVCYVEYAGGLKSRDVCKDPVENPNKKTREGLQLVRSPYIYFNCGHISGENLTEIRERLLK